MTPDVQAAIDDLEYCVANAELFGASAVTVDTSKLRTLLDVAAQPQRHAPLTDDPCGAHITPAGRAAVLDYKAIRREQQPRPRLGGGPS